MYNECIKSLRQNFWPCVFIIDLNPNETSMGIRIRIQKIKFDKVIPMTPIVSQNRNIPKNFDVILLIPDKDLEIPYLSTHKTPKKLDLYQELCFCGYPTGEYSFTVNKPHDLGYRFHPVLQFEVNTLLLFMCLYSKLY